MKNIGKVASRQKGRLACWSAWAGVSVLLLACSPPVPEASPVNPNSAMQQSPSPTIQEPTQRGQQLPISAQAIISGQVIQLEVARTSEEQATGLMHRSSLADDRGMLFPFDYPRQASFWMKNVLIPLDMIFLQGEEVKAIAANALPCKAEPCPTYGPSTLIDQVIELRGGRAAELNLQVGDRIQIKPLKASSVDSTVNRL